MDLAIPLGLGVAHMEIAIPSMTREPAEEDMFRRQQPALGPRGTIVHSGFSGL